MDSEELLAQLADIHLPEPSSLTARANNSSEPGSDYRR